MFYKCIKLKQKKKNNTCAYKTESSLIAHPISYFNITQGPSKMSIK